MSSKNMFDLIESGYAGRWGNPGLDRVGPTQSIAERERIHQREELIKARQGRKSRKSYYEKQLEKFGFLK